MTEKNITFEDLPKAMTWMMDKLNELTSRLTVSITKAHNHRRISG